jgi:two-component system response regulator AtoC
MKKKVLLAEDDAGLSMIYREELGEEGYEVRCARNGEEAIRQFEQERPDLVVLDIVMPVMDGIEAMKRIREISENSIPIILHTSHPKYLESPDTRAANALILKTADLTGLKQKIAELLGG